jgi:hypothetical protein
MLRTQASESLLRCEEGWDNKTNDEECEWLKYSTTDTPVQILIYF